MHSYHDVGVGQFFETVVFFVDIDVFAAYLC